MAESNPGQPFDWEASERLLVRTFEAWRSEFRGILEDHRREIQDRLEKIEREIEKKSDKETVELLVHSVQEDLRRHADDIKTLESGLADKMGVETMWKLVGLVLTLGAAVGGLVSFAINNMAGN